MADYRRGNVADILFGPEQTPPAPLLQRVHEAATTLEARDRIAQQAPHIAWPGVWQQIEQRLPEIFDIDLQDIFAGAFSKYRELKKYADIDKYPADKPVRVPLGERKLVSTHRPHLEVEVDGFRAPDIEFAIKLEFRLTAAVLELRGGVIHGLDTGKASVKGSVWLGKVEVWRGDPRDFDLPGHLDLERGIALPWFKAPVPQQTPQEVTPEPIAVRGGQAQTAQVENSKVHRRRLLPGIALLTGLALLAFLLFRGLGIQNPAPHRPPTPDAFSLTVVAEPADAEIRILNIDRPYYPGIKLAPGRYDLEVARVGFRPLQQSIELARRDLYHEVQLVEVRQVEPAPPPPEPRRPGTEPAPPSPPETAQPEAAAGTYALNLSSDPPGADISIRGIGDYAPGMRLKPGEYTVRLRLHGYQTTWGVVRLNNRDLNKRFELQESLFGN